MSRDITNKFNKFLDDWVPPRIRDCELLVRPLFRFLIGKDYIHYIRFKDKLPYLTEKEINSYYKKLHSTFIKRETDCNRACINRIINETVGMSILDVAGGKGYMARTLFRQNPRLDCTVCDIVIPTKKEQANGVKYRKASITNLPFQDDCFDTVICTHALEHIKDSSEALREIRRVCKRKLIIVLPRQREYKYTYDLHLNFYPYRYNVENFVNEGMKGDKLTIELLSNDWICIEEML